MIALSNRISKSERKRQLGGKSYNPVLETESAKRNVAAITKQPGKPKVTGLKPPTTSTSKYVPGSNEMGRGRPIAMVKPEKNESFYQSHTEHVVAVPGKGWTRSEMIGFIQQSDVQNKQQMLHEVQQYPKGTRFHETNTGYQINIPKDVVLNRPKTEAQRFESYPPVIKEVSRSGYFITQGMFAGAKPIFNFFGKGEQFDKYTSIGISVGTAPFQREKQGRFVLESLKKSRYGVHYVSPTDYVFEPIGWSPKGSTQILKKYPVESTVGGIGAEYAQGVGLGKASSLLVKTGGKGARYIIKKSIRFADDIPIQSYLKSPTLTKGVTQIGGFVERKTNIPSNLYKWTKGYKPGKTLVKVSLPSQTKKGFTIVKRKFVSDKNIPFWKRRQFLSPDNYATYQSKIAQSGQKTIIDVNRVTSGVGEKGTITEKTVIKRSKIPFRSTIYENYLFKRDIKSIGKRVNVIDDQYVKKFGSSYADDVSKQGSGILKDIVMDESQKGIVSVKKTPFQEMFETGYSRTRPVITESKKIGLSNEWSGAVKLEGYPGWGRTYRPSFRGRTGQWDEVSSTLFRSDEASASLLRRQFQKPQLNRMFGRKGIVRSKLDMLTLPSRSYRFGYVPYIISKSSILYDQSQKNRILNKNIDTIQEKQEYKNIEYLNDSSVDYIQGTYFDQINKTKTVQNTVVNQSQKQTQIVVPVRSGMKKQIYPSDEEYFPYRPTPIPPPYWKNRKIKSWVPKPVWSSQKSLGYRERTWKVPTLEDLIPGGF